MKKWMLIIIVTICGAFLVNGVAVQAASSHYLRHTFYGSSLDDRTYGVAIDSEDSSIMVGRSLDSWTGPAGEEPRHPHSDPGGSIDFFILKLDRDGRYLWHTFYGSDTAAIEGDPVDYAMAVAVDGNDNILVTGFSAGTWNGPAPDSSGPLNPHSGGLADAFVLKLDSSGDYVWHTFYGSGASSFEDLRDEGHAIAVDGANNIYVGLKSGDNWTGPAPDYANPKHAYSGGQDLAVLKLGSNGDYQWHTFMGGQYLYEESASIAVDGAAVYVAGTTDSGWTVGTDEPLNAYAGGNDIVVVKLDSDGDYQWHTFYGSAENDGANGVIAAYGYVYITGYSFTGWNGPAPAAAAPEHPFSTGQSDIMALKLNSAGTYQWHTFYGAVDSADYGLDLAFSGGGARLDIVGRSYAGWTAGSANAVHAYTGAADLMVLELDTAGNHQWHTFYGSLSDDWGQDIAVDSRDYVHAAGTSWAGWEGDSGTTPGHAYHGGRDICELVLGAPPSNYHRLAAGGELQAAQSISLIDRAGSGSAPTSILPGLALILLCGGVGIGLRRLLRP
jgi:hypothetical protein